MSDEKTAPAKAAREVRVLVDHGDAKTNQVLSLSADGAAEAVSAGWADDNPAAVKFAKKLAADKRRDEAE